MIQTENKNIVKKGILRVDKDLRNLSTFWFIIVMLLFNYLVARMDLFNFLPDYKDAGPQFISKKNALIESVFIAPLFETLLYQKIIISLCDYIPFLNKRKYLIILISALAFAWNHLYSIRYAVQVFFSGGITLGYAYVVYEEKEKHPYWVVFSIHGFWNLLIFILK